MRTNLLVSIFVGGWLFTALVCRGASESPAAVQSAADSATNQAAVPMSVTEDREKASLEKHARPLLEALKLNDPSKEGKVRGILMAYFAASKAFHEKNDAQLKGLWMQFSQARAKQDEPKADEIMSRINAVYVTFKPQHDELLTGLGTVLAPEQIERIKDLLTVNKVNVTFHSYGQIFHGLTDDQKAFLLQNLKEAREEAMDAGSMQEKSAFFKKYKIKIEAYLTAQGYDVKQSYKDFVAKQKADMAASRQDAVGPPTNSVESVGP